MKLHIEGSLMMPRTGMPDREGTDGLLSCPEGVRAMHEALLLSYAFEHERLLTALGVWVMRLLLCTPPRLR